jgi:hypothetical protein
MSAITKKVLDVVSDFIDLPLIYSMWRGYENTA